jgi:hypothetical protein
MKIYVDSSLFCSETGSIGRLHGAIELPFFPVPGCSVSFLRPSRNLTFPNIHGFDGVVKVDSIILDANCESDGVLALLGDITVLSRHDAMTLADYLRDGFGVFLDESE